MPIPSTRRCGSIDPPPAPEDPLASTTPAPTSSTDEQSFELHGCIGVGGFGEVYRATMVVNGTPREVAVKILHPGIDPTAQAIQRLQDEAFLLGMLQHPSIIRVVDLLQYRKRLALVTEYVDGEDLSTCFLALPPPSPRAMVEIVGRVANALDAAWRTPNPRGTGELQLIHRDIKPSNIRISSAGEVKLLDFGLAHADHEDRQAQTEAHTLLGSFLYMAPERYLQRPATSAADAFALGCCLFEGLAGEKLFEGRKPVDLYGLLLDGDKWDREMDDRIAAVPSTVPIEARTMCRALLCREPEERMTVTELADSWEDVVEVMTGPTLQRWASQRTWGEPEAIRASLSGSVVASRIVAHIPPIDETEDAEDAPTVLLKSGAMDALIADLDPLVDALTEEKDDATQVRGRPPTSTATAPLAHPKAAATVPLPHPKAGGAPPEPARAVEESGRRVNWLGAGLFATTTLVVGTLVVGMAAVVLATWLSRPSAPPPAPVATEAPPEPPPAAEAHVEVRGVSGAHLSRGSRQVPAGDVPAGMWTLWVDYGDGAVRVDTLRVRKGDRLVVECDPARRACKMPGDEPVANDAPEVDAP